MRVRAGGQTRGGALDGAGVFLRTPGFYNSRRRNPPEERLVRYVGTQRPTRLVSWPHDSLKQTVRLEHLPFCTLTGSTRYACMGPFKNTGQLVASKSLGLRRSHVAGQVS